jgi:two-component system nitrogen regulation response regulator GlnG
MLPESDTTLEKVVYKALERYFSKLNGEMPPCGLYKRVLTEVERPLFFLTIRAVAGNQQKAAEILGINRNTLRKKMVDVSKNSSGAVNLKTVVDQFEGG